MLPLKKRRRGKVNLFEFAASCLPEETTLIPEWERLNSAISALGYTPPSSGVKDVDWVSRLAEIFEDLAQKLDALEDVCRHKNVETVTGRKRDYLYCNDCDTELDGGDS
jgi:hypothetical protein